MQGRRTELAGLKKIGDCVVRNLGSPAVPQQIETSAAGVGFLEPLAQGGFGVLGILRSAAPIRGLQEVCTRWNPAARAPSDIPRSCLTTAGTIVSEILKPGLGRGGD